MKRILRGIGFAACVVICSTSQAQDWALLKTGASQVALDYSRDPALAHQKYRNVELQIGRSAVIGAPGRFPSGRTYLPVLGLGARPVHAIFPADEIPQGIGKSAEISMTCTAQGLYTLEGQATFSADQGFLTLSCTGLRVLSIPGSPRSGPH